MDLGLSRSGWARLRWQASAAVPAVLAAWLGWLAGWLPSDPGPPLYTIPCHTRLSGTGIASINTNTSTSIHTDRNACKSTWSNSNTHDESHTWYWHSLAKVVWIF